MPVKDTQPLCRHRLHNLALPPNSRAITIPNSHVRAALKVCAQLLVAIAKDEVGLLVQARELPHYDPSIIDNHLHKAKAKAQYQFIETLMSVWATARCAGPRPLTHLDRAVQEPGQLRARLAPLCLHCHARVFYSTHINLTDFHPNDAFCSRMIGATRVPWPALIGTRFASADGPGIAGSAEGQPRLNFSMETRVRTGRRIAIAITFVLLGQHAISGSLLMATAREHFRH